MKLNTQTKSVQSAGMNIKVDFNIDMNGKAFNVLSSGMYSDIVSTIVRELSSNAYDSHIAAGKPGEPFTVYCPSAFDPHFGVRDYGVGLRYFKYNANIVNEHDGESTVFIDGDIREQVEGINLIVLNGSETINVGATLYDNTNDKTVLRIPTDVSGENVTVEFDDTLVLYSTYFRSTKELSNDFTGAFGLGSKTPLAYTDNFIVVNRFNGTKRIYNIMTNEDSMPQINLMMSTETSSVNGLEVKIAVAPEDYREFREAIVTQLKYFEPQPIVKNDTVKFPEIIHKGEHFILFDDLSDCTPYSSWSHGHGCVGNNAYEVKGISSELFRENMVLRFNIGEVMVTASREELKYDDSTNEFIQEREREALDEYTTYVLDTLEDDSMDSYEKAEFLNQNHTVIDLSTDKVREKVGNPNFRYTSNSIGIPITIWGTRTDIDWIDVEDENGVTKTVRNSSRRYNQPSSWSEYKYQKGRTEKYSSSLNLKISSAPMLVFVRDNSYSFLKKIKYYLNENDISAHSMNIWTLDTYNEDYIEMVEEVAQDRIKFVYLSSIELPKNISTVAYGSNTTPVARLFQRDTNSFSTPKYWTDVYTPLTQITTDAYIMCTHRNEIEELEYNDYTFMSHYLESGGELDEDIKIIALSRARYEKALSYGFKPVNSLINKLKGEVEIPVTLINRKLLQAINYELRTSGVLRIFEGLGTDIFNRLDDDSPIRYLLRVKDIAYKWNDSRKTNFDRMETMIQYMSDAEKPEPSEFVTEMLDKVKEMLHNVDTELTLLDALSTWGLNEEQKEKIVQYANTMLSTGE